ncbi:MAG: DUF3604 domain-containing protein, partial [Bacteroidota bacterium]
LIVALVAIGFYFYQILFPEGPIETPLENPIRDRAASSADLPSGQVKLNPLNEVYFGDLHVHTSYSFDAYIGGTRTTPDQAYRFAKGETIEYFNEPVKIVRPLDFAAVTDHAEYIGELYSIQTKGAKAYGSAMARYFRGIGTDTVKMRKLFERAAKAIGEVEDRHHLDMFQGFETTKAVWDIHLQAAKDHYEPGKFTTFAAYEWTLGAHAAHIHRNIIFRDMKVPDYPISALEAVNTIELYEWLNSIRKQGATVMAIPHNSNLSQGTVFAENKPDGTPFDKAYVEDIARNEPLVEVFQAKGGSEVHARYWPNDEFADFENYTYDVGQSERNYVRFALKEGLALQDQFGTNPYKYGLIGSTDTHNGTPGNTEEDDEYIGNHTVVDWDAYARRVAPWALENHKTPNIINPGGLVAVWAKANTRGEIYDAMLRKETYATSGGRIQLRFFGGANFNESKMANYQELVKEGYEQGTPMGSDLNLPEGESPSFLIWASKDAQGANLDRVQVIKGWYADGQAQEKIYNVALSDNRIPNEDGTVPDNGAAVNLETGEWDQSKGAISLTTIWTDPAFDPNVKAFYYLRVLEVPTARWTLWDKIRYNTEFPEGTPMTVRERAWSSPIWYTPK